MSHDAKKQYLLGIRSRYCLASKSEKKKILDEFCSVCHYNRKYAIRILRKPSIQKNTTKSAKRGPKKQYDEPQLLQALKHFWRITNLPCSKRLKAIIHLWLPYYPYYITDHLKEKLLSISPATIDRLMKPMRSRFNKLGLATTKPGSILRKHIPIKTNQWEETIPGFLEADTLAHCGNSVAGMFVYSINCVDIATGWSAQRAVWGKGERGVMAAINSIEKSLPFPILGFDCDNGSEFLNWHLYKHLSKRKQPVQFTRSRAYHKNDNAHIEEKNWSHLRQYLGYQRFEDPLLVGLLNELYTSEWNQYFNFFIPSLKLIDKLRLGSKTIKKYEKPKTPFQRLLQSYHLTEEAKQKLIATFQTLNPFLLQKQMKIKIDRIINLASAVKNPESIGNSTTSIKTKSEAEIYG